MNKIAIALFIFMTHSLVFAEITCPTFFGNHMVLQRETNANIWGWATPNEDITIQASWGEKIVTIADATGTFKTSIPTPKAGGPYELRLSGSSELVFQDVMIGEVWFCAGQSNMQTEMAKYYKHERIKKEAQSSSVRLFTAPLMSAFENQKDIKGGQWTDSEVKNLSEFSATAYFFGRKLEKELGVPVGLIVSAWGGRKIQCFIPWKDQKKNETLIAQREDALKRMTEFSKPGVKAKMKVEFENFNTLKKAWVKSGRKGPCPKKAYPPISPLEYGKHPGGIYAGIVYPFCGYNIKGFIWYQGEDNSYRVEGVGYAKDYGNMFKTLVQSWRKAWGLGDLSFYPVQLPEYRAKATHLVEKEQAWPYTRESVRKATLELENCRPAITLGYGEADDIHPKKKKEVGDALARLALKFDYHKDIVWSGPVATSCDFKASEALITFDNGGAPLSLADGEVGLAILGKGSKELESSINIVSNNELEVKSVDGSPILEVYYAWADNPRSFNIENKKHLTASPFHFLDSRGKVHT